MSEATSRRRKGTGNLAHKDGRWIASITHCPHTLLPRIDEVRLQQLHALLQQKPRDLGVLSDQWTLESLSKVSFEQGITREKMSDESMRQALKRLGVNWKKATAWITSNVILLHFC